MDTTYENAELTPNNNVNVLGPVAISYLLKAAKWAKFLSIIGFIVSGILAIAALSIGSVLNVLTSLNPMGSILPSAIGSSIAIIYLGIAAVIFTLHLFLYQFASRTQKALDFNDSALMDGGIHRLQSYFKMLGIIMIIYLTFLVLGILALIKFMSMIPHVS